MYVKRVHMFHRVDKKDFFYYFRVTTNLLLFQGGVVQISCNKLAIKSNTREEVDISPTDQQLAVIGVCFYAYFAIHRTGLSKTCHM